MQIWSLNYHILEKPRNLNIVYIGRYLVLTYIERCFSPVCCHFSYICWSANCLSWVGKFQNFFLTWMETERRIIFEGFNYCPLWKLNFQLSDTFLAFFVWALNCSRHFLVALTVNKLYKLNLWIIEHMPEMSRSVSINLYSRPWSIAIYGKYYLLSICLYLFRHFRFFSGL